MASVLKLRGGGVGPKQSQGGADYYDQFSLDYGIQDKERIAGALRGFVRSGALSGLRESDPFFTFMNKYLEDGPEPIRYGAACCHVAMDPPTQPPTAVTTPPSLPPSPFSSLSQWAREALLCGRLRKQGR